jgi:Alpha-2,8-polysialyltransferase (POLYST)
MTTQIVLATTAFGLVTATAAYESGMLARCERRILAVACTTAMPEATAPMRAITGVPDLMSRFDAVYDYNAIIEPLHPSTWRPRPGDLPLWERHFRLLWDLGDDDLHLVVESIHVNPAQALVRIFGDARIDVYADGLMSYGPTRTALPEMVAGRIERLLHLDLVPGVRPLLLSERQVPTAVIPTESFRRVAKIMVADRAAVGGTESIALILGQYLAGNELVTEREELDLYTKMVSACAAAGYSSLVFKPHPSAAAAYAARLNDIAHALGVRLAVVDGPELAEAWFERGGIELVVGCFSTALLTASSLYGLPVAQLGTEMMLEQLTPFQNSNRIPVTLVDALLPNLSADLSSLVRSENPPHRSMEEIGALVLAVGYAMQPQRLAARRTEAAAFLAEHYESHSRYFKRRRLTRLGLPGSLPAPASLPQPTIARRVRRRVRRVRNSVGQWLVGASRPQPAPIGQPRRCPEP